MNELQAGVEPSLAVLPQPAVLLQPRKAALNNPALGHDLEGVHFTAFGNLHRPLLSQDVSHSLGKGLTRIASVDKHTLHLSEFVLAARERRKCSFAICHVRLGDADRVEQSQGVHRDVALDARDFFACIVAFEACCVSVLDTLRIHDQERAAGAAHQSLAGRANLIFLKPAPAELASSRGSLQMAQYEYTVRHFGKSLGNALHWQPVRSRYNTAQNTSYSSILRGAVFLRALQQRADRFKLLT